MRDIKFRAWHNQTGTWKMEYFDFFHADCFAMSKNVMQFTGLRDVNGKEIYEGDIVYFSVFDYNGRDTQYKGAIVYSGSQFQIWKSPEMEWYGVDGAFDLDWVLGQDDCFEILGNIYENPELLGEVK